MASSSSSSSSSSPSSSPFFPPLPLLLRETGLALAPISLNELASSLADALSSDRRASKAAGGKSPSQASSERTSVSAASLRSGRPPREKLSASGDDGEGEAAVLAAELLQHAEQLRSGSASGS